jgi:two-component sensor histidine kinase
MKKHILLLSLLLNFNLLLGQNVRLEAFLKMSNDSIKVDSLSRLGVDLELKNVSESIRIQTEALKVAESIKDKKRIGISLYRLGVAEKLNEKYTASINYLQRAYTIFEEEKIYKRLVRVSFQMGVVYRIQGENELTQKYLKKTYDLGKEHHFEDYQAFALGEMAIFKEQKNELDEAAKNQLEAISIYKKIGDKIGENVASFNLVAVYNKQKKYDEALKIMQNFMDFAKEKGTNFEKGMAYTKLAEIYFAKKDFMEANRNNNRAIELFGEVPEKLEEKAEIYELSRKIYTAQNDIPSAYNAMLKWRVLNDSLVAQNNRKTFATLQTKFETTQKEAQIKALDQETKNQRNQLFAAIIGLSVLVLLLGLSVYLYQNLRKNKQKVEEQANQLSTLMKELHHRVKNNLAIISSLLNMQSNRMEDKNAAKAVKEGQMRVQAMSLIHQKLYKTDNISTVNIETYLQELAESLMQAYNYSNDDFDLEIKAENPEIDVDMAIPIGLIVNELITNSMKYAYEGISRPALSIHFKNEKEIKLQVKDNGIGFDEKAVAKSSNSFGTKLIKGLSSQLKGRFEYKNEGGTIFELTIPKAA